MLTRAVNAAAGKLMHEDGSEHSLADYNRAGVPLLEIVSEPDMTSAAAAAAYGAEIRRIVRFLGVSNGNMQAFPHPHPPPVTAAPMRLLDRCWLRATAPEQAHRPVLSVAEPARGPPPLQAPGRCQPTPRQLRPQQLHRDGVSQLSDRQSAAC